MAHAAIVAPGTCCPAGTSGSGRPFCYCLLSQSLNSRAFTLSAAPISLIEKHRAKTRAKKGRRLDPVAALPMYSLAGQHLAQEVILREYGSWTLDEPTLKTIYLVFCICFCWGCCVFAAMNEPFYDSDLYRKAGGDGTQNWMYRKEEEEEVQAREELWREELIREIEERVGEAREIKEAEKEKELV